MKSTTIDTTVPKAETVYTKAQVQCFCTVESGKRLLETGTKLIAVLEVGGISALEREATRIKMSMFEASHAITLVDLYKTDCLPFYFRN